MKQLSALDAVFAYGETQSTPMHIGQLLIYDPSTAPGGKVGFKDILRYLESRLDGARIFRQKLVRVPLDLDHPYWVEDENFDLEYHVRHIALPHPGDWRQFCIQAARIYARPLDMKRPLWECTVIEGLDNVAGRPPGCFGILYKLHHAAIDGQSGLAFALALHDFDANMTPRKFDMDWKSESDPSNLALLAKAQINNLTNPIRGLQALQKLLPLTKKFIDFNRSYKKPEGAGGPIPKTRFNGKVSPHRVIDGREFSLSDIKKIRTAFPGTTVNDVILAVTGGAMRSYLKAKDELPKDTLKVAAPISTRTDNAEASGGNEVSMMIVGVGSHLADAGKRLDFVHKETKRSKAMSEAMGARTLMDISSAMPAGLTAAGTKLAVRMGLGQSMAPQANCTVSNIPGPPVKLYFAGAEIQQSYGLGLVMDGMGLFHAVTSYSGNLVVTILSDREMMPDPAVYADALEQSFSDLMKAAVKRAKKKASMAKGKAKPKPKKVAAKKTKKRMTARAATAGKGRKK